MTTTNTQGPKVLLIDIETAPLLVHCWGLFDQNIGLNQVKSDWHLLSYSAKWLSDSPKKIIYEDQRNVSKIEDDSKLLNSVWKLLDEADVVVSQNGRRFDVKKLNARFVLSGMSPPSSFKQIDTLEIAKKYFSFTSNKLEYMSDKLCIKYKKQTKRKFAGFDLWKECLAGNLAAWKEMEKYNKYDVLALEELYEVLIPWDSSVNFNLYNDSNENKCKCGSSDFTKRGFFYTGVAKYQRYQCKKCGAETRDRKNLFSKAKGQSLKVATVK
jgi:Aeromonas phage DNA polymerase exonuclease subunit